MTRAAIALIALLILTLSAGFTSTSLQRSSLGPVAQAQRNAALAGELDVRLLGQPAAPGAAASTSEDGPAPALLAYLALVLVGSVVAIASVRASQRRES